VANELDVLIPFLAFIVKCCCKRTRVQLTEEETSGVQASEPSERFFGGC
jgi:hypothetical protein